jgi:hypothetical protein
VKMIPEIGTTVLHPTIDSEQLGICERFRS